MAPVPSAASSFLLCLPLRRHLLRLVLSCLLCFFCSSSSSSPDQSLFAAGRNSTDDRRALLAFKSMVTSDPPGALDSWNDSVVGHLVMCTAWRGVACGGPRHPDRVVSLDLQSLGLTGTNIPAAPLADLTFLRRIHLGDNQFHGNVPPELGSLFRLQHLNLSRNALVGGIPAGLADLGRRLVTLDLSGNTLTGGIPPWLGNFSSLAQLRLSNNIALGGTIPASLARIPTLQILHLSTSGLSGGIPPALGNLAALTFLSLSNNSLSGPIPPSLGNLTSLRFLRLNRNSLEGDIPTSLCHLPSLTVLDAVFNNLSGVIPPSIGNLSSSIQVISFTGNNLVGPIPTTVRNLASLTFFTVALNRLEGTISSTLYNLSASLATLDLRGNRFSGTLQSTVDMGSGLPNLENFSVGDNQIHGPIPSSLCNATGLRNLLLDNNSFTGLVPPCLGNLGGLQRLTLYQNRLEARDAKDWSFLAALTNCTHLEALGLHKNNFGGILPADSISNLSRRLDRFDVSHNRISGSIPEGIGNLVGLAELAMSDNLFVGPIPASFGKLEKLVFLDLSRNRLSGVIPSSAVSNLTQLAVLRLSENNLQGDIPPALGVNMRNLQELVLSYNQLGGVIPGEVVSIRFLSKVLDLSHNSLTGPVPPEIGRLENVNSIDLSGNNLSGGIPASIGRCQILESLYLQGNALNGSIPQALGDLKGIRRIDLSRNSLTGNIPEFLADLRSLEYLNLSFNDLQGKVPEGGAFRNSSAVMLVGNRGELCSSTGGYSDAIRSMFRLPACPDPHGRPRKGNYGSLPKVFIPLSAVTIFLLLAALFWYLVFTRRRSRSKSGTTPAAAPWMDLVGRLTYSELFKATDGFSPRNLVGVGSFGSVYKANIGQDSGAGTKPAAVKVINLQQRGASKSFMAECEALRNIRHRNLLKIITSCSSVDQSGNSFKALVFEYMTNGSLDKWLHRPPAADQRDDVGGSCEDDDEVIGLISVTQRLSIAIDVASALEYLHVGAHRRIIHCDLKPSNVLLDDDMTAHVGDFGLARFLAASTDHTIISRSSSATPPSSSSSSAVIRGTVGYAAPEYGMGCKPSTQGDVYSYGILLLEMITGRRPTDAMFKEELTLRKFVETSFPARVLEVVDEKLLLQVEELGDHHGGVTRGGGGGGGFEGGGAAACRECLVSMLSIALRCSNESPRERMKMEDVVKEMTANEERLLIHQKQRGRRQHGKKSSTTGARRPHTAILVIDPS